MRLNKKQKFVLVLGIIAFIILGSITNTTKTFGGYSRHGSENLVAVTDYGPLIFRLLSVCMVTTALIISFKSPKN